jgi:hypothetical protein
MKIKPRRTFFAGAMLLLMVGCANSPNDDNVVARNDAIDDYIEVADLNEVDQIRVKRQLHHKVITEDYIIIYDDKDPYLAAFIRRCRELNDPDVTPDFRQDPNRLYAKFDTYRGCRMRALYEVTSGQAQELINLGKTE